METYREILGTSIQQGYDVIVVSGGSTGFATASYADWNKVNTQLIKRK